MKGAKFLTQSNYTLERVLQILVWGSGGHLVLNRYTYLIYFLFIHYNMIDFIYIHDYMGPGYVGAACCTILRSGGP